MSKAVLCPDCGGSGVPHYSDDGPICQRCNGKGKVITKKEWVNCERCYGKWKEQITRIVKRGIGIGSKDKTRTKWEECSLCYGKKGEYQDVERPYKSSFF